MICLKIIAGIEKIPRLKGETDLPCCIRKYTETLRKWEWFSSFSWNIFIRRKASVLLWYLKNVSRLKRSLDVATYRGLLLRLSKYSEVSPPAITAHKQIHTNGCTQTDLLRKKKNKQRENLVSPLPVLSRTNRIRLAAETQHDSSLQASHSDTISTI